MIYQRNRNMSFDLRPRLNLLPHPLLTCQPSSHPLLLLDHFFLLVTAWPSVLDYSPIQRSTTWYNFNPIL